MLSAGSNEGQSAERNVGPRINKGGQDKWATSEGRILRAPTSVDFEGIPVSLPRCGDSAQSEFETI